MSDLRRNTPETLQNRSADVSTAAGRQEQASGAPQAILGLSRENSRSVPVDPTLLHCHQTSASCLPLPTTLRQKVRSTTDTRLLPGPPCASDPGGVRQAFKAQNTPALYRLSTTFQNRAGDFPNSVEAHESTLRQLEVLTEARCGAHDSDAERLRRGHRQVVAGFGCTAV